MSNLKERLDLLREEIQKDDFLDGKGLSNEVNIRIFCYDPAEEMTVTHFLDQIKIDQSLNCRLIECNLYKTFFPSVTILISRMQSLRWKMQTGESIF